MGFGSLGARLGLLGSGSRSLSAARQRVSVPIWVARRPKAARQRFLSGFGSLGALKLLGSGSSADYDPTHTLHDPIRDTEHARARGIEESPERRRATVIPKRSSQE
jgi:hypothetical protein